MDGVEVIDRLADLSQLTQTIVLTGNATIDSAAAGAAAAHLRLPGEAGPARQAPDDHRSRRRALAAAARRGGAARRARSGRSSCSSTSRTSSCCVDEALVVRYVSPSVTPPPRLRPNVSWSAGRASTSCTRRTRPATEAFLRDALGDRAPTTSHELRVRHGDGDWRSSRSAPPPRRPHRHAQRAADRARRHRAPADGAGAAAGAADGQHRPARRRRRARLQQHPDRHPRLLRDPAR